jgi:hypothetical protein
MSSGKLEIRISKSETKLNDTNAQMPQPAERREARQLPRGRVCKTKPISEEEAAASRQPHDGACETKPIFGAGALQDNLGRAGTLTLLRETKPNARRPAAGSQMTDRAKQSQTWEGWGIWGKVNVACWPFRQRVERAKQSQFVPPSERWAEPALQDYRTRRRCETKPIFGRKQGQDGLATCAWAVVQNKANCQETGNREQAATRRVVRNKANFRIAEKEALFCMVV